MENHDRKKHEGNDCSGPAAAGCRCTVVRVDNCNCAQPTRSKCSNDNAPVDRPSAHPFPRSSRQCAS